jgi:hypothetical protein
MVSVIMMGMIMVFTVITTREGTGLHSIMGASARPGGRVKFLGNGGQSLFSSCFHVMSTK